MTSSDFKHLISKHPYHIMVRSSPLPYPINFVIHTRIVLVTPEYTHRREIHWKQRHDIPPLEGHLFFNQLSAREGFWRNIFRKKKRWNATCLYHLQGSEEVLPQIQKIESLIKTYPHKHYYRLLGINSNSFTQYLLDKSGIDYKIPWNAFGKRLPNQIMDSGEFQNLIKENKYHIMVRSTPLPYPMHFAMHTRIVLITPDYTHRREVHRKQRNTTKNREGFLYLNYQKPDAGRLPGGRFKNLLKGKWEMYGKCIYHLQGSEELLPQIQKIESLIKTYPHKHHYRLLGINSNSFTQYLLDKSGINYKLPQNAFGKKIKIPTALQSESLIYH